MDGLIRGHRLLSAGSARVPEKESIQQTSLRLLALLSFQRLLPSLSNETSDPVNNCYLDDFCRLLAGETLTNTRVLLERMALSLRRQLGRRRSLGIYQLFDIFEELPLHVLDGFSDTYLGYRLKLQLNHSVAWHKAYNSAKERQYGFQWW